MQRQTISRSVTMPTNLSFSPIRNRTDIMLAHQSGELDNGRVGVDPLHTLCMACFTFMDSSFCKCRPVTTYTAA